MSRTRDPDEIRDRIADLLGYCRVDGELHDPSRFEERFAGIRWQCPDCSATVGRVEYHRAKDLQWVLMPGNSSSSTVSLTSPEDEDKVAREGDGEEGETDLLENVQNVQESLTGDEDSTLEDEVESLASSEEDTG